jgi:hypothetical protein
LLTHARKGNIQAAEKGLERMGAGAFACGCLKQGLRVWHEVVVTGATDNLANDAFSRKRSSTRLPLLLFVLLLARSSSRKGIRLNLDWIPRLENLIADDITNMKFDA